MAIHSAARRTVVGEEVRVCQVSTRNCLRLTLAAEVLGAGSVGVLHE